MKAATTTERRRRTHPARAARPPARPRRLARPVLWPESDEGPEPVIQELISRVARGEAIRARVF